MKLKTVVMKKVLSSVVMLLSGWCTVYAQCNTALIISQGHPAYASSQESAAYAPGNAFDGDRTTRWSSAFSDPQYLYVDLGAVTDLCDVDLIWEAAYGKDFTIDISDDASSWTTVATITGNTSLTNTIPITGSGRYVRMNGTTRGTPNGYSLYGMHVYGTAPSPSCSGTDLALGDVGVASSTESIAFPASSAFDGDMGTRWSSAFSDPQSLYADLGTVYNLCNVTLHWEAAYATDFTIDVSQDAAIWSTLATITGNTSTTNIIPVSGLARYVRMFGTARATGYGYSLYEFTVNGYIPLPITLGDFSGSVQNGKTVILQWTTLQESNNDHFSIERSYDGHPFSAIGTVPGKGNSSQPFSYVWIDSFPAMGKNLYRLKQVDKDEKFTYSSVINVAIVSAVGAGVTAYPNPVVDALTITSREGEHILAVTACKATGQQIMDYKSPFAGNVLKLPMKGLAPGVYIIKVSTDHQVSSFKVLKNAD
jgi:hypothetical protein